LPAASSVIFSTRASACRKSSSQRRLSTSPLLVDGDRLLERHLALLEPLDDRFELFDRPLEGEALDVGMDIVGHDRFR
jgi:hypothetical protein